ncbi:MFS transporter [Frigidibacter sp. ROC022]|uniref:MFS transporter n=1 Tax=Frigidibacter sp. ROC022 TaxID=2971796 RepID=UPI00215AABA7|nr:MFS transporter [Frigidibacter sp. ROC022]MCR8725875.1 MFS transporter [Frigidibacter sp. ROC022]
MIRLPDFSGARRALGPGPFRIYTVGNVTSLIGTWMQRISVGYLTWEMTHSATWLGLMAFADLFPTVIIGPFAGVAADRWSRQQVLRITQFLGLVQALSLAVLHMMGLLSVGLLLVITLALGIIAAFAQPSRLALISSMVPRELVASAVAVNAISFNLARFLGPAVAGVLISTFSVSAAFAVNALTYAVFIWALARLPDLPTGRSKAPGSFWADLFSGFGYIRRERAAAEVLLAMAVSGIAARPVIELMPGFAGQVFDRGAAGLAALTSAIGIGAMLGGAWMAARPPGSPLARPMVLAGLISALGVVAFACAFNFFLALVVIALVGGCWVVAGITAQTLLQLGVASEVRGRVLAIYGLILKASPALGALATGSLADVLGLRFSVAGAAILASLYMAYLLLRVRQRFAGLEPEPQPDQARTGTRR